MATVINSLVAADIFKSARDEHPLFDDRRHPKLVLLRALSRYQRRLVPKITRLNTKFMTTELKTALPLADFTAGITMPDYTFPASTEVEAPSDVTGDVTRWIVDLVSREARLRYDLACYFWNNKLYLTGKKEDWQGFTQFYIYYVAEVEPLTTLTGATGTLVVPNAAEPCLVAYMCHFMAQRTQANEKAEAPDKKEFRASWRETENEFLEELGMHVQAEVSVVRDVF